MNLHSLFLQANRYLIIYRGLGQWLLCNPPGCQRCTNTGPLAATRINAITCRHLALEKPRNLDPADKKPYDPDLSLCGQASLTSQLYSMGHDLLPRITWEHLGLPVAGAAPLRPWHTGVS